MPVHDVDVWLCTLTAVDVSSVAPLLSPDEHERAERFRFERDRVRFVAARGVLRLLLGRRLLRDPRSLRFALGDHGKPRLEQDDVRFNVSHSGDFAAYAVSDAADCGIDVEQIRATPDLDAIAQRFFSASEAAALAALPAAERVEAFFRCWTRKEAIVKATGIGLSLSLQSFDVPIGADALPRVVDANAAPWSLHAVPVPAGHAGALAVGGEQPRIAFHAW
jgi:4'-phosphopantetheinyl transferase